MGFERFRRLSDFGEGGFRIWLPKPGGYQMCKTAFQTRPEECGIELAHGSETEKTGLAENAAEHSRFLNAFKRIFVKNLRRNCIIEPNFPMKIFCTALAIFFCFNCYSQTNIRYFKDESLTKRVSPEKANYKVTINQTDEGLFYTTVHDLRSQKIILTEDSNGEQLGFWLSRTGKGKEVLDYNFTLNYSDTICQEGYFNLNPFSGVADEELSGYTAPLIAGAKDFLHFLAKNLRYPRFALENNIQGKVFLRFEISKAGI